MESSYGRGACTRGDKQEKKKSAEDGLLHSKCVSCAPYGEDHKRSSCSRRKEVLTFSIYLFCFVSCGFHGRSFSTFFFSTLPRPFFASCCRRFAFSFYFAMLFCQSWDAQRCVGGREWERWERKQHPAHASEGRAHNVFFFFKPFQKPFPLSTMRCFSHFFSVSSSIRVRSRRAKSCLFLFRLLFVVQCCSHKTHQPCLFFFLRTCFCFPVLPFFFVVVCFGARC